MFGKTYLQILRRTSAGRHKCACSVDNLLSRVRQLKAVPPTKHGPNVARVVMEIKANIATERKQKGASYLKRSLVSVQHNRVLSHFHFAQCFHLNTIYRNQFHDSTWPTLEKHLTS